MPVISGYAREMLDAEMEKWADHPQGELAQAIIAGVKAALFGPPSREVAGTCRADGLRQRRRQVGGRLLPYLLGTFLNVHRGRTPEPGC